jgi:hypothetical protein
VRPVETVLGLREEGIKENDEGMNSSVTYLLTRMNLCKFHSVPPPSTTIKKSLKIKKSLQWQAPTKG